MIERRKISAILAADVVGFSRMTGADEDLTLARLRALRTDLIDPIIASQNGRVFKRTGDGALVEFRSVVEATRCAISLQNAMAERNVGTPDDQRIIFRIGLHLGDVVEEADGDLMGDGVNIAARLEGICEPGGLCLSDDAWRQVRDRITLQFVDLGEIELKNIVRPVRAYSASAAIVGAAAPGAKARVAQKPQARRFNWLASGVALVALLFVVGGLAWRTGTANLAGGGAAAVDKLATAPKLSIVVLPFSSLSSDTEQDYFADGLTEDLTTDLSHLDGSFVIARNTAFTYKGKAFDVKRVGRDLGVRYVLEGSVRRVGENVTVNAQLISTETGAHVWADRFEGEHGRLGQFQIEFVSRLANSLGVELVKAEALRSRRDGATNPDAIDFLMRGLAASHSAQSADARKAAMNDLDRALKLDPKLVPALATLSMTLSFMVLSFQSENPAADQERAESLALQAISIQPQNALGHLARVYSLQTRVYVGKPDDWYTGIAEAEAAIAADRNLADAYANAGFYKVFIGHAAEGFAQNEIAMRLSPRDPFFGYWQFNICHLHSHLAEWEQAIEWCRKSIISMPDDTTWARLDIASALAWTGRTVEAKQEIAEILKLNPDFTLQTFNAIKWTGNPVFNEQYARMSDGLRKAGLPEGKRAN